MKLGFDEDGDGPVALLVHGFPVDRRIWSGQLSGLSGIRRVVAVDLRGRGKSPADSLEGWTMDAYAGDLAETIDALGLESVDLVGLSMGGYIAFALLRRYPKMIRSLVLMSTKADEDSLEAKLARDETAALVKKKGTGALVERLYPKVLSEHASEEVRISVREMFESIPGEVAAADSVAMRDRPDSNGDLASITVPAVVIQGEEDQLLTVEGGRSMADKISGCSFVSIPRAGHFAPLENPEAVNEALRRFLKRSNA